ncbi:MAG TPA: Sec-independent protein translocase protein TatB [Hyphomicrobiaceae bacterium]|nr:Sec-independent protein translocase protein TatB [Hyphomicrobiaceae bacterium]
MFDITSWKLILLAVIALLVVGPKDLPVLLRTLGKYVGYIKRQAADFRAQFDEAVRDTEIEQIKKEMETLGRDLETQVRDAGKAVETEVGAVTSAVEAQVGEIRSDVERTVAEIEKPAGPAPEAIARVEPAAIAHVEPVALPPPSPENAPPPSGGKDDDGGRTLADAAPAPRAVEPVLETAGSGPTPAKV